MCALSYLFTCFCRSLGGAEYTKALCSMEKRSPEFSGEVFFCDPRLVANGFKVRLIPGMLGLKWHGVTLLSGVVAHDRTFPQHGARCQGCDGFENATDDREL